MSLNLAFFQKPSRYIGNEVNIVRKKSDIKMALCFPDTYEIGMSHMGLKILYSIINNIPCASAERVFAPWIDYESYLREKGLLLKSLENDLPLKDFDVVGFTLQYELSYTNILNMLDLGGIPVRAEDRGGDYPIIIAGGPCAVNPLPLIPFIDAFVIGDGEEIIKEIIEIYRKIKSRNPKSEIRNKEMLLKELSKLEGVYVPSIHDTDKDRINKRIVEDIDNADFPKNPIVPFALPVHDRVSIEISRGCTKGCRFCQAGMIYRPLRERSLENILNLSQESISNTGYEEISFSSLSTGDYSNLLPLIRTFNNMCSGSNISISLPSLRVGSVSQDTLKEIKSVRKTGFTIAPEAGTKRIRDIINKDFTEEEYENTLEKLFTEGWQKIKLYFMIGLPTETHEDIEGIIRMTQTALSKGRKITGGRVNINVGISAFVPKPHTPFQWFGQMPYEDLRKKQTFLRKAFKKKGINFKGQHIELSLLEAVFSRGGRDCAVLLETAWKAGCRFDSWSETFDFDKWISASKKAGMNLYQHASQKLDINQKLPWDFVSTGIKDKFLKSEYKKALDGKITEDCRRICHGCGLECKDRVQVGIDLPAAKAGQQLATRLPRGKALRGNSQPAYRPGRLVTPNISPIKMRVRFSKTGKLCYLSHREVMTTLRRAMNRAGIPLIYSEGFHPHPKISFGPALPVGVEGKNEYFDIELPGSINPSAALFNINDYLPDGLKILAVSPVTRNRRSLDNFISRYEYEITIDKTVTSPIKSFLNLPRYLVTRGKKEIDIRPMVEKAVINNIYLQLILVDTNGTKVRLHETLKELLQKSADEIQTIPKKRVQLYGYGEKGWADPLEGEKIWLLK